MAVKLYNIEEGKPMRLAERVTAYGSYGYGYGDDVAVLEPDDELEEDVFGDEDSAEWDEVERESVMLGIEQMLKGQCGPLEESFDKVFKKLEEYEVTHRWN